jgi:hypothetical protein
MKEIRILDCVYCEKVSINTADEWIKTYVCDDCYKERHRER